MIKKKYYHFTNMLMFAIVMRDEQLCIELLERIIEGRKIKKVKFQKDAAMDQLRKEIENHDYATTEKPFSVESEKTIIAGLHAKSVRLDVLFQRGMILKCKSIGNSICHKGAGIIILPW